MEIVLANLQRVDCLTLTKILQAYATSPVIPLVLLLRIELLLLYLKLLK